MCNTWWLLSMLLIFSVQVQLSKFESQIQWFSKNSLPFSKIGPLCSIYGTWPWCWTTLWSFNHNLSCQYQRKKNNNNNYWLSLFLPQPCLGLYKAFSSFIFTWQSFINDDMVGRGGNICEEKCGCTGIIKNMRCSL